MYFSYDLVCPSVSRLVGWSVRHHLPKGRKVTLPCFYRSTCWRLIVPADIVSNRQFSGAVEAEGGLGVGGAIAPTVCPIFVARSNYMCYDSWSGKDYGTSCILSAPYVAPTLSAPKDTWCAKSFLAPQVYIFLSAPVKMGSGALRNFSCGDNFRAPRALKKTAPQVS